MKRQGVALALALLTVSAQTAFSQTTLDLVSTRVFANSSSGDFTFNFNDGGGFLVINPGVNPAIDFGNIDITPGIPPIRPGDGSAYNTGSSLAPSRASGTPADLRSQGFDTSAYFNSGSQNYDPSFALRLGNGVDPRLGGGFDISSVPEPSTLALGALAVAGLAARGLIRRRS